MNENTEFDDGPPKALALTDEEIEREKSYVELEQQRIQLEAEKHALEVEKGNRKLRTSFAVGAVVLMVAQIVAANLIFRYYAAANDWDVPVAAMSAWLGTTVVQVVAVVLVVMNYLFHPPD